MPYLGDTIIPLRKPEYVKDEPKLLRGAATRRADGVYYAEIIRDGAWYRIGYSLHKDVSAEYAKQNA